MALVWLFRFWIVVALTWLGIMLDIGASYDATADQCEQRDKLLESGTCSSRSHDLVHD
jgi:hypothetical protein